MVNDRVVHIEDVVAEELEHASLYRARRYRLSRHAGGRGLGCSLLEVPPGKTAFAYHHHLGNEEAIYVLEGRGTLRLGHEQVAVRPGHWVALPPEPEAAHQLINTGDEPLRYLAISTMNQPDVVVYPDADKLGVFAGAAPGGDPKQRSIQTYFERSAQSSGPYAAQEGEAPPISTEAEPDDAQIEKQIEKQIEEEIEALKKRLGIDKLAAASSRVRAKIEQKVEQLKSSMAGRADQPEAEQEAKRLEAQMEKQIDDEIATLKKKLKLE